MLTSRITEGEKSQF